VRGACGAEQRAGCTAHDDRDLPSGEARVPPASGRRSDALGELSDTGVELIQRELLRVLEEVRRRRRSTRWASPSIRSGTRPIPECRARTSPTCRWQRRPRGYLLHGRVLRPAMVTVAVPPTTRAPRVDPSDGRPGISTASSASLGMRRRGAEEGLPQTRPRLPSGPQPRRQEGRRNASRRSSEAYSILSGPREACPVRPLRRGERSRRGQRRGLRTIFEISSRASSAAGAAAALARGARGDDSATTWRSRSRGDRRPGLKQAAGAAARDLRDLPRRRRGGQAASPRPAARAGPGPGALTQASLRWRRPCPNCHARAYHSSTRAPAAAARGGYPASGC